MSMCLSVCFYWFTQSYTTWSKYAFWYIAFQYPEDSHHLAGGGGDLISTAYWHFFFVCFNNTNHKCICCNFALLCTLTHCRLNRLSHTIYWKSPISILGMSGWDLHIPREKLLNYIANSGDPDQTQHSVASDLGLHCLPIYESFTSLQLQWVKG